MLSRIMDEGFCCCCPMITSPIPRRPASRCDNVRPILEDMEVESMEYELTNFLLRGYDDDDEEMSSSNALPPSLVWLRGDDGDDARTISSAASVDQRLCETKEEESYVDMVNNEISSTLLPTLIDKTAVEVNDNDSDDIINLPASYESHPVEQTTQIDDEETQKKVEKQEQESDQAISVCSSLSSACEFESADKGVAHDDLNDGCNYVGADTSIWESRRRFAFDSPINIGVGYDVHITIEKSSIESSSEGSSEHIHMNLEEMRFKDDPFPSPPNSEASTPQHPSATTTTPIHSFETFPTPDAHCSPHSTSRGIGDYDNIIVGDCKSMIIPEHPHVSSEESNLSLSRKLMPFVFGINAGPDGHEIEIEPSPTGVTELRGDSSGYLQQGAFKVTMSPIRLNFRKDLILSPARSAVKLVRNTQQKLRERRERRRLRRLERINNPPRSWWICIPADHPLKVVWDVMTMIWAALGAYRTHIRIRDRVFEQSPLIILTEIWFTVDILLNFITEHKTRQGEVIRDGKAVWARYLTTWFIVDILSLIPWESIYVKPIVEKIKRRNFFQKTFFRSKAVIKVSRVLRGRHIKLFGKASKRSGVSLHKLVALVIRYLPKYLLFLRNMRGALVIRGLRAIHWLHNMYKKIWVKARNTVVGRTFSESEDDDEESDNEQSVMDDIVVSRALDLAARPFRGDEEPSFHMSHSSSQLLNLRRCLSESDIIGRL